jgi:hypothetical protein
LLILQLWNGTFHFELWTLDVSLGRLSFSHERWTFYVLLAVWTAVALALVIDFGFGVWRSGCLLFAGAISCQIQGSHSECQVVIQHTVTTRTQNRNQFHPDYTLREIQFWITSFYLDHTNQFQSDYTLKEIQLWTHGPEDEAKEAQSLPPQRRGRQQ